MVQPFVKVLPVNAPKPPPVALIVPLIVADVATKSPANVTLNGLDVSDGPVPPDQKDMSVDADGLLIPAV